jgi:glycosyltransferase involved in cell wall biosynthesis
MTQSIEITVCMPVWNSGPVLKKTLQQLATSAAAVDIDIRRLLLVDNNSKDDTVSIAEDEASRNGWELTVVQGEYNLPEAREVAINRINTEWFLFLDDDVRLPKEYLTELVDCIAPRIGAIQGRKGTNQERPWEWTQRRVHRGGTHATLIRTASVSGLTIPSGIDVLEDEYIRRAVESNGYIWIFNHQARFEHDSMDRHSVGLKQGYIAGRYDLMPLHTIMLALGEGLLNRKAVRPRLTRLLGWIVGRLIRRK